jgi:oxygen-dependent protoporphyrinogen oxidase
MIGIVGGGISGLFLLHLLRERGMDAVLFEASTAPGGVMQSVTVPGPHGPVTVDLGPQRMRLTRGLREILDRLDLRSSVLRAPPGIPFTVLHGGRLFPAPMSLRQAAATGLISPLGKLRALADPLTAAPTVEESVAEALERKLGREIYLRLVGPLFGGLYGSDPAEMPARHTLLPALRRAGGGRSLLLALMRAAKWERLPVISFCEGMGTLPRALARAHAERVRLGARVAEIRARSAGEFEVVAGNRTEVVEALALTLEAPEAARLIAPLSTELGRRLAALRYNPLAVVPLVAPGETPVPPMGSGVKVTLEDRLATRGVTAHETLFGRKGLFTAFLGGMGREEVVARSDDEIMETARRDLERMTGIDAVPLLVHRTRMPAWDRSWAAFDGMALPKGIHLCAAYADRPGIAGRLENAHRTVERLSRGTPSLSR